MKQILFVISSHKLTEDQIKAAEVEMGIEEIILLKDISKEHQEFASNVPADLYIDAIVSEAIILVAVAKSVNATHLYIAGEPSLMMHTALKAHEDDLIVVQSTTERKSWDAPMADGKVSKMSIFKHVQWRRVFNYPTRMEKVIQLASKPLIRE
jgi:hypothetical protein